MDHGEKKDSAIALRISVEGPVDVSCFVLVAFVVVVAAAAAAVVVSTVQIYFPVREMRIFLPFPHAHFACSFGVSLK